MSEADLAVGTEAARVAHSAQSSNTFSFHQLVYEVVCSDTVVLAVRRDVGK